MTDASIIILTRDGNGLNIKPSNLKMASISEKQQRIFDLKRRVPPVLEGEARLRAISSAKLTNNKQVTQYNMKGKKIKSYSSITAAAIVTGISQSHIGSRANGIEFSAGDFIWRFGKDKEIDIKPMLKTMEQRWNRNKNSFGKKVTQYNMNGKRIAIFPTISDAAETTDIANSEISNVIQKKRYSAGGFYWQKGYGPAMIDLSNYEYGQNLIAKKRQTAGLATHKALRKTRQGNGLLGRRGK